MKMTKAIVSLIVCLVLLCSLAVSAFAASINRCLYCVDGTVTNRISKTYEHDELFPCIHGLSGYDRYEAYEVYFYEDCNKCSHRVETEDHIHEFVACEGW